MPQDDIRVSDSGSHQRHGNRTDAFLPLKESVSRKVMRCVSMNEKKRRGLMVFCRVRIRLSLVHGPIGMLGWCVDRVEFQRLGG